HALHHVDEVEHHAALGAEHEVEVAQADVEIDDRDLPTVLRERRTYRSGGSGLANSSLARRHHQHLGHLIVSYLLKSVERRNPQRFAFKPRLRWSIAKSGVELFGSPVEAVDGQELGLDLLAIDARGRIAVDAGHGATTQRAVDVDGAAGDDLGAGSDRAHDRHVAFREDDRLAGAHVAVDQQRGRWRIYFGLLLRGLRHRASAPAREQGRHVGGECGGLHALYAEHADVALLEAQKEMGFCV